MQVHSGKPKHLLELFTDKGVTLDAILRQIPYTTRCTYCSDRNDCDGFHITLPASVNIVPNMVIIYAMPMDTEVRVRIRYQIGNDQYMEHWRYLKNIPASRDENHPHTSYNLRKIIKTLLLTAQPPHPASYRIKDPRIAVYTLGAIDAELIYIDYPSPNPDHC